MKEEDITHKTHYCINHDIKVYPEIYQKFYLKLVVDVQGKKIYGKEKYDPNRRSDQKKIQAKVSELYSELYDKMMKKSKN